MIACLLGSPHILESFLSPEKQIRSSDKNGFCRATYRVAQQDSKTFGTQRYLRLESWAGFSSVFKLFERFCLNFVLKVHSDIVVIYTGLREGLE